MQPAVRALRGATTVDVDEPQHITERVHALLGELFARNDIHHDDVISVLFTATDDIHSMFPAAAARKFGLGDVPLLCALELHVDGAAPRCIRVMLHLMTKRTRSELHHVYLEGAKGLRDDLPDSMAPPRANIIGTGLIGGSIGAALRDRGWHVTGDDADESRASRAVELGALDAVGLDRDAQMTFVAVPVRSIADAVKRALAETGGLVTDVGGVKGSVVAAIDDDRFVGGHPMAGSEQDGVEGADPRLFEGAVWVLTPTATTTDAALASIRSVIVSLGADVVSLSPERHDALVAVVSHVPHLTAATLMRLADERAEEHRALLRLAAGGFRDMTRVAAGHPGIWPDICTENQDAIVDMLDRLIASLTDMRRVVADSDRDGLLLVLERAQVARRNLPSRVTHPEDMCEVRVPVLDRAGVLADVTTLAADLDVSIADLEIAHSSEGDRGVLILLVGADQAGRFEEGLLAARLPAVSAAAGVTLDATVRVPGSKSLTNRALVCAALAHGDSIITGALRADDTDAMAACIESLGAGVEWDGDDVRVTGRGLPAQEVALDARQSGTTARFLLPVLATGAGTYRLDGEPQLRHRPLADLIAAVRRLGAGVDDAREPGHLPVTVSGGPIAGGSIEIRGDVTSQFLSGLLLAGPCTDRGIEVVPTSPLVGRPYLDLTVDVMRTFGATVDGLHADAGGYRPANYTVEPDASTASYFFAAAAIRGGRVTVTGLGARSHQGDIGFVDLLAAMGATVDRSDDSITVSRSGTLRGIDANLADLPDMALTLAVVAVFADGPTRITGVGFTRGHESDRINAAVTELRRCGITAAATPDGFTVEPGQPHAARITTYRDHRVAMAFALLGLQVDGIELDDPGCVAKTFPAYFETLARLQ